MKHTAIIQKVTPRQDGGFLLRVRVEDRQKSDGLVSSPTSEPEGKRIEVEGAGALWRRA